MTEGSLSNHPRFFLARRLAARRLPVVSVGGVCSGVGSNGSGDSRGAAERFPRNASNAPATPITMKRTCFA